MPAPNTVDELLALIRKSNLIEPARLDAYLATRPGTFATPTALCHRMQADGLLTPFHVEQLLRGKHRGYFISRYKILDRIGLGGMGQVFLAEHTGMKRRVAVKVMPPDRAENPYSRERFFREARAAGRLDHPNLVRSFDVDQDGATIFLVMEFIDGVSLHDLVTRHGPLDPARAAHYLFQAAHGLAYLADRGFIHRDVKPANILVDRGGVVKVLDLGLVRSETESDELTRGEGVKILGTADYLAPEQAIDCSKVDIRADVYGLGATGYFLLTGQSPFEGPTIAQKLIAHQVRPVPLAHAARPAVPPGLSAVVAKMMAKRAADRYQTPAEVMAALEPWCGEPPPPPTAAEIPLAVGTPDGAVDMNLPAGGSRGGRSNGSAVSLGGSAGSGSAIKYQSNPKSGPTDKPKSGDRPAPAAAVPPVPLPAPTARKRSGFTPPSLPVAATHRPLDKPATPGFVPPVLPKPRSEAAAGGVSRGRRRVSLALALALTVALTGWTVAVLTGVARAHGGGSAAAK